MAYGRDKGFKLGGSKRGPGLKLNSDLKTADMKGGGKAKKAARKKV